MKIDPGVQVQLIKGGVTVGITSIIVFLIVGYINTAKIDKLKKDISDKDVKVAELSGKINKTTSIIDSKMLEISILHESIKDKDAKVEELSNKLINLKPEVKLKPVSTEKEVIDKIGSLYNDNSTTLLNGRFSITAPTTVQLVNDAEQFKVNYPICKSWLDVSLKLNEAQKDDIKSKDDLITKQESVIVEFKGKDTLYDQRFELQSKEILNLKDLNTRTEKKSKMQRILDWGLGIAVGYGIGKAIK